MQLRRERRSLFWLVCSEADHAEKWSLTVGLLLVPGRIAQSDEIPPIEELLKNARAAIAQEEADGELPALIARGNLLLAYAELGRFDRIAEEKLVHDDFAVLTNDLIPYAVELHSNRTDRVPRLEEIRDLLSPALGEPAESPDVTARCAMANALARLGRFEEATAAVAKAPASTRWAPLIAKTYTGIARRQVAEGLAKEARESARLAVAVCNQNDLIAELVDPIKLQVQSRGRTEALAAVRAVDLKAKQHPPTPGTETSLAFHKTILAELYTLAGDVSGGRILRGECRRLLQAYAAQKFSDDTSKNRCRAVSTALRLAWSADPLQDTKARDEFLRVSVSMFQRLDVSDQVEVLDSLTDPRRPREMSRLLFPEFLAPSVREALGEPARKLRFGRTIELLDAVESPSMRMAMAAKLAPLAHAAGENDVVRRAVEVARLTPAQPGKDGEIGRLRVLASLESRFGDRKLGLTAFDQAERLAQQSGDPAHILLVAMSELDAGLVDRAYGHANRLPSMQKCGLLAGLARVRASEMKKVD